MPVGTYFANGGSSPSQPEREISTSIINGKWLARPGRGSQPVVGVLGDVVEDVVARLRTPLVVGGTAEATIERRLGGSGANLATGLAALGVAVRLYGRVGRDERGGALVERVGEAGVDARLAREGRTATVLDLVDADGVPSYVTDTLTTPETRVGDDLPRVDLADLDLAHLGGWWLLGGLPPQVPRALARAAHAAGCTLSLDLASTQRITATGPQAFRTLVRALAPDLILGTEAEAHAAKLPDNLPTNTTLITTNGAQAALVRAPGHDPVAVPTERRLLAADTTGAGDRFAAGVLAAALAGATPTEACVAGHRAAQQLLELSRVEHS